LHILSQVNSHGDLDVNRDRTPELISEVDRLMPLARQGPERRDLVQLRALAARCAATPGTSVVLLGD
jgi:hypothetical protein